MSVTPYPSPLRYPGGKRKLANFVKLIVAENGLYDGHYAEPYAGGASVALALLYEEYVSHIHINDLNRSVYAFWHCVLEYTDELCERIRNIKIDMSEWHRQRAVQEEDSPDLLDLAYSTFFLNRTNRSGIIWGGVIGGKEQTGEWKIDARFNKQELVKRITKIRRYAERITVTNLDAEDFLAGPASQLPKNSLTYLDPPYFEKGSRLYFDHYKPSDHKRVAQLVMAYDKPWVVSYDNNPAIVELYEGQQSITYGIGYSAQNRYEGKEIIFFSKDLIVPDVDSPSCVSKRLVHGRQIKLLT